MRVTPVTCAVIGKRTLMKSSHSGGSGQSGPSDSWGWHWVGMEWIPISVSRHGWRRLMGAVGRTWEKMEVVDERRNHMCWRWIEGKDEASGNGKKKSNIDLVAVVVEDVDNAGNTVTPI